MTWTWRYEGPDGSPVEAGPEAPVQPDFPTQSDAESWVGEVWRELLAAGISAVSLYDGDHKTYGPMSLEAP
ncbi:MAG: hypothetical protein ABR549_01565 [Mycobacteriales bacterium]